MVRYETNILNSKFFGRKEIPFTVDVNVRKPLKEISRRTTSLLDPRPLLPPFLGGLAVRLSRRDFPPAPAAACASEGAP